MSRLGYTVADVERAVVNQRASGSGDATRVCAGDVAKLVDIVNTRGYWNGLDTLPAHLSSDDHRKLYFSLAPGGINGLGYRTLLDVVTRAPVAKEVPPIPELKQAGEIAFFQGGQTLVYVCYSRDSNLIGGLLSLLPFVNFEDVYFASGVSFGGSGNMASGNFRAIRIGGNLGETWQIPCVSEMHSNRASLTLTGELANKINAVIQQDPLVMAARSAATTGLRMDQVWERLSPTGDIGVRLSNQQAIGDYLLTTAAALTGRMDEFEARLVKSEATIVAHGKRIQEVERLAAIVPSKTCLMMLIDLKPELAALVPPRTTKFSGLPGAAFTWLQSRMAEGHSLFLHVRGIDDRENHISWHPFKTPDGTDAQIVDFAKLLNFMGHNFYADGRGNTVGRPVLTARTPGGWVTPTRAVRMMCKGDAWAERLAMVMQQSFLSLPCPVSDAVFRDRYTWDLEASPQFKALFAADPIQSSIACVVWVAAGGVADPGLQEALHTRLATAVTPPTLATEFTDLPERYRNLLRGIVSVWGHCSPLIIPNTTPAVTQEQYQDVLDRLHHLDAVGPSCLAHLFVGSGFFVDHTCRRFMDLPAEALAWLKSELRGVPSGGTTEPVIPARKLWARLPAATVANPANDRNNHLSWIQSPGLVEIAEADIERLRAHNWWSWTAFTRDASMGLPERVGNVEGYLSRMTDTLRTDMNSIGDRIGTLEARTGSSGGGGEVNERLGKFAATHLTTSGGLRDDVGPLRNMWITMGEIWNGGEDGIVKEEDMHWPTFVPGIKFPIISKITDAVRSAAASTLDMLPDLAGASPLSDLTRRVNLLHTAIRERSTMLSFSGALSVVGGKNGAVVAALAPAAVSIPNLATDVVNVLPTAADKQAWNGKMDKFTVGSLSPAGAALRWTTSDAATGLPAPGASLMVEVMAGTGMVAAPAASKYAVALAMAGGRPVTTPLTSAQYNAGRIVLGTNVWDDNHVDVLRELINASGTIDLNDSNSQTIPDIASMRQWLNTGAGWAIGNDGSGLRIQLTGDDEDAANRRASHALRAFATVNRTLQQRALTTLYGVEIATARLLMRGWTLQ